MRSWIPLALAGGVVLALGACSDVAVVEPGGEAENGPEAARIRSSTPGTITGSIGPGATYRIVVPPSWNGDLALYAHGFVDPEGTDPLTPAEEALVSALAATGHAVALSSFSENGLAVKDGAQRTKQLRGVFVSRVGRPGRTYLVGGSLGGLIGVNLAERFPRHYDGVLALCGMVGGSQAQVDYVANVRVLFDALYPGVLPGGLFEGPSLTPGQVAALVTAAVTANPAAAGVLANVMAATFGTPVPAGDPAELLQSIVTALVFDVRAFSDVLDRTHGHSPFDNSDVRYVGSPNDAALNAAVARFTARPDALNYLERHYEPTGELRIPVLTLHNALDPTLPIFHERRLASAAADAGASAYLVQRTASRAYGHCAFTEGEVLGAFGSLVTWARTGVAPAAGP